MSDAAIATAEPVPEVLSAPRAVPRLSRRILVTGSGGMLGSDLVPVLAGAGHDVFARPRSDLDITREADVARAFREIHPHVVVNCAAFTRVDDCESDPRALEVNARAVHRLADHSLRHGAQLVQISTDFVFDGRKRKPYSEEDAPNPLSAYGRGKLQGEEAALRVPSGLVVRSSWLFGSAGPNFIEAILKQVEAGRRRLEVVNDQTGLNYWMEFHFPVLEPRTFLYPVGSATLGYGVPAAIGAKIAHPDRQVLAVLGDGGFMFSVNELATAVKYGLGIVFLVLNDQRYGAIKYLQEGIFGKYGEVDLANPDFPAMARAFGAEGLRVESVDDLPKALDKALAHAGPTLLELPIAVDPPWEISP